MLFRPEDDEENMELMGWIVLGFLVAVLVLL